jgi:hypothetical protein
MNRFYSFILVFGLAAICTSASGQDTLPKFSARNVGKNRIIIGWENNYDLVKQISIQSSHDSLNNFKTIMSVTDPNAKQNGFADTKAPNDHMYYRLFVVLDKGQFYFTPSKRPVPDTATVVKNPVVERIKDTISTIVKQPPVTKNSGYVPSFYVYTNKDGYVFINLPDADKKKYHIKFFEEDDNLLFEIKNIKDAALTLDKTNFLHAGWFKFELYNDEKLVEKNKFYLAKEF